MPKLEIIGQLRGENDVDHRSKRREAFALQLEAALKPQGEQADCGKELAHQLPNPAV